jgi:hypothetical protein
MDRENIFLHKTDSYAFSFDPVCMKTLSPGWSSVHPVISFDTKYPSQFSLNNP